MRAARRGLCSLFGRVGRQRPLHRADPEGKAILHDFGGCFPPTGFGTSLPVQRTKIIGLFNWASTSVKPLRKTILQQFLKPSFSVAPKATDRFSNILASVVLTV